MHFECPGCGEKTPDVTAEGGKPVYCTQCGRGYRFIYGFFNRQLYFVFNHPLLIYFLLLIFAVNLSSAFPGSQRLLYLMFFTGFYWFLLRWARRSHRYLEPLPTGPLASPHPPSPVLTPATHEPHEPGASPAHIVQGLAASMKSGLPFFVVAVFLLNLLLFPAALFAGFVSLQTVTGLLLDLIHGSGGGTDLIRFLSNMDLGRFRESVALYSVLVVLTSLFFLGVNILALSATRARKGRGKELVIWSFIFWFISTLLLGAQVVTGWNLITDWQYQERMVKNKPNNVLELGEDPLFQWTMLHAWRRNPKSGETLVFFDMILGDRIKSGESHGWVTRGLALSLASRAIRDQARLWKHQNEGKGSRIQLVDRICGHMIKDLNTHPDPAVRKTAEKALQRLCRLPFEVPRSEHELVSLYLDPKARPAFNYLKLVEFGSGQVAMDRALAIMRVDEKDLEDRWIGPILASFLDPKEIADRLIRIHDEAASDRIRSRVLHAMTHLRTVVAVPMIMKGLNEEMAGLRYKSLRALYKIYNRMDLPKDLYRVRRYYWSSYYHSKRFNSLRYKNIHRSTARLWQKYLTTHPEDFRLESNGVR